MTFDGDLFLSISFTVLLLFCGHYFKWGIAYFARSEVLTRLYSYTYGLLSILAGMSILAYIARSDAYWLAVAELAIFSVAGGLATAAFYGVDRAGAWHARFTRSRKIKKDEKLEI